MREASHRPIDARGGPPWHSRSEAVEGPKIGRLSGGDHQPVSPGLYRPWTECEMGDGYHLYSYPGGLALSGSGVGFIFSPSDWVVDAAPAHAGSGHPSRVDGRVATEQYGARYPSFGSGNPVYVPGVSSVPQDPWPREQHEWRRKLL